MASSSKTQRAPRPPKNVESPAKSLKRRHAQSGQDDQPNKQPKVSSAQQDEQPRGIIPNWLNPGITYEAWVDVFLYAASEGTMDSLNTNWLIQTAIACQTLSEPALTALYRCPTIRTAAKLKRFVSLLERPVTETRINYRAKIESLYLDIDIVPQTMYFPLIHHLPALRELIVFCRLDQPPYRELDRHVRWTYPEDIFRALLPAQPQADVSQEKSFPTTLKSWEWSGRFIGGHVPKIKDIVQIHQTPSFSHLTRVSFTNFQVPSLNKPFAAMADEELLQQAFLEDEVFTDTIGNAIAQLKFLKHLVFESSTVMTDRLLALLPKDLVHLELINCWEIKSEDLAPFLRSHGRNLRALTLFHNQSLNLAFLTDLAEACPELKELRMNLSYYRLHETVDDAGPMYDCTLLPNQVPSWPSSLRLLSLTHVRGLDVETMEMFLKSLIDQAPNLPHLQHLTIKAMLDIPWQSRATIRRDWREKMDRVFLRPFEPPASTASTAQQEDEEDFASPGKKKRRDISSPSRRSGRLAVQSDRRSSRIGKSSELRRQRSRPSYRDPDTDEDEFDVSGSDEDAHTSDAGGSAGEDAAKDGAEPFIQGRCTTVVLSFDNQKVRELQYGMEDFQGADSASEDEWDGDFEDQDDPVVF